MSYNSMQRVLLTCLTIGMASCGGGDGGTGPDNTLTAKGSLRGTVQETNGAPVSGATVQISLSGQANRSTTSASDGTYGFVDVPIGVWQVAITPPAGFDAGATATVTVTAGQQATVPTVTLTRAVTNAPLTANVAIASSSFQPQDVTIKAGGTVTWTNNDDIQHTATGSGFDSGPLNKNASFAKTFVTAGTFSYICSIHPGMTGRVIVSGQ